MKYRQLIEAARDMVFRVRVPDGSFEYVSPSAKDVVGYPADEIMAHPLFLERCIHPDFEAARKSHWSAVLSGQVQPRWEYKIIDAEGRERWITQTTIPVYDPSGRLVALEGCCRDETNQRSAQQAVRDAAKRLEDAQRVARMGSWELDLQSNVLTWSKEIYRIFEIDLSLFGASYEAFLAAVHPQDRDAVDKAYKVSLESRTPYEIVHRLLMPDGRIKWVNECGETEFDAAGRPLISRGTVQDITDLKLTEDALRESEATLAAFLRVSPEAVIVTDTDARIKVFSAGAESIFGYGAREVLGQDVGILVPERFRSAHGAHVRKFEHSLASSRIMRDRSEIVGSRKTGEEFPAEASLSKLKTPKGTYFAAVLRDISQQKAAQGELLAAKLAAEGANEAKSRFIANMSHELRTPLNAIIGFAEVLAQSDPDVEKARDYANNIRDSGKHLLAIINDILQMSRLDLGALELHEDDVDLADTVDSCLRMMSERAKEARVSLEVEHDPGLPFVAADRRLLIQAILNLLTNAIKFTDPGGRVAVGATCTDGGVAIAVRDTGIGMQAEAIARIGQPFMQADNKLARRYEGTGLGLAITKRLIELHQGSLTVQSVVGDGTTVVLRLPASRVLQRDRERAAG